MDVSVIPNITVAGQRNINAGFQEKDNEALRKQIPDAGFFEKM
jgi:hypothetical protein